MTQLIRVLLQNFLILSIFAVALSRVIPTKSNMPSLNHYLNLKANTVYTYSYHTTTVLKEAFSGSDMKFSLSLLGPGVYLLSLADVDDNKSTDELDELKNNPAIFELDSNSGTFKPIISLN